MSEVSDQVRGRYEDERKLAGAAKMADERKTATNAKAILGWLTPSNARTDRLVFVLRNAANLAKTATFTRLESRRTLNALREDAAKSLNMVCGLVDKGHLTEDAIDLARETVAAWLNALPAEALLGTRTSRLCAN